MRRIEEQHPECSFAGARMLSMMLTREGRTVGLTLMKRIGLHALYRKPNTSKTAAGASSSTRLCCAIWRSSNQTMFGRLISRTFR